MTPTPTPTRRRTTSLTPDETVVAAQHLLARDGVEGFSMRKLAAHLGVNPMTIYLRFENKDALLRAVANRALAEIPVPEPAGTWEDQIVALLDALRARLLADRTTAVLLQRADDLPGTVLQITDRALAVLTGAGVPDDDAVDVFRLLFWHTIGAALAEPHMRAAEGNLARETLATVGTEPAPTFAALRHHFGPLAPDVLFERTVRILLRELAPARPA